MSDDKMLEQLFNEIREMKQNMATKEDVADIPLIKRAVFELSERVDRIERDMVRKEDLQYVDLKISEHDREIFKLKTRLS